MWEFLRNWIGVDADICSDVRGGDLCAATQIARLRPDGARVAMSLPMDVVFFEKIEFPGMGWKVAENLLPGKFDLKLPVPIEKCLLYVRPVTGASKPVFLAFAVPRDICKARLASFRAATGCDPEGVFPAAAGLADACLHLLVGERPTALVLHAAAEKWTLVAIEEGILSGVVTVEADDIASVVRNAKILALRFSTPLQRFLVSGAGAEKGLAERLNERAGTLPCRAEAVPKASAFLASGLARTAAARDGRNGFRQGIAHPAALRRRLWACLLAGLLPLALAVAAFATALFQHNRSTRRLAAWNGLLDQAAARVANGPLPQHGRAAVERAKGLFDWRNPALAAQTEASPLDALPALFEAASARGMTFSRIAFDGRFLALSGHGTVEADVDVLRQTVEKAGFRLAAETAPRAEGIGFSATVSAREGGVQ